MVPAAYLNWRLNGSIVNGYASGPITTGISLPVSYPSTIDTTPGITITSSANDLGNSEVFNNIRFYLDGDPAQLNIVQNTWPYYGIDPNNPSGPHLKPELDGGLDISFDNGNTFIRFDQSHGYKNDSSTWILLPSSAISNGIAGVLRPFDSARLYIKLTVPPSADQFQVININIQADFDII